MEINSEEENKNLFSSAHLFTRMMMFDRKMIWTLSSEEVVKVFWSHREKENYSITHKTFIIAGSWWAPNGMEQNEVYFRVFEHTIKEKINIAQTDKRHYN